MADADIKQALRKVLTSQQKFTLASKTISAVIKAEKAAELADEQARG
tara:strand:- start:1850 stop:1990 length:141 start_codon:yes stop_codon:yes gene_type:complete